MVPDSIERITFDDGSWWEIKTILTRGMRKAITRASLKAVSPEVLARANQGNGAVKEALLAGGLTGDLTDVEDTYLLAGTHRYSFGETADLATIDGLPDEKTNKVLVRLYELYNKQQLTQEERAAFLGTR